MEKHKEISAKTPTGSVLYPVRYTIYGNYKKLQKN